MQAVLWDLDGTIIDSSDQHYRAWRATLGQRDMVYEHKDFLAGFGQSNQSVLTALFHGHLSGVEIKALSDEKEAVYRQIVASEGIAPLPGVLDWLGRFEENRLVQVVSSSAPMANIVATIGVLDIADYFRVFMSGATLPRGKPDPSIFLHSAQALDLAPAECIVIEDSIHGVEAARRAGMACVAVGDLSRDKALADLLERTPGPPCTVVNSLTELTWARLAPMSEHR